MSKQIEFFRKGEKASARKLNIIVEELRRLQQIKAGEGVKVVHTKNGVIISRDRRIMTIDDRYQLDVRRLNSTDLVRRFCDLHEGDLADVWRVRATPEADPNPDVDQALYRLMWYINRSFGGGGHGGEGGWITDAGLGEQKTEYFDEHTIAPPTRRVGQIGDIVILTDDDFIINTEDGDKFVYSNIRHDAHHHLDEDHDGRIYFTRTPPGQEPFGLPLMGEMIGDPGKANDPLSELKKESVEWRPQIKLPTYDIPGQIYLHPEILAYRFPAIVTVPDSHVQAWEFYNIGKDAAWAAHYQIPYKIPGHDFGFLIKYSATGGGALTNAYMELDWKAINNGESMSVLAGVTSSDFLIPVPAGSTEDIIRYLYIQFVPDAQLSNFEFIMIPTFARDWGNALDTLASRLLIIEVRPIILPAVIPP